MAKKASKKAKRTAHPKVLTLPGAFHVGPSAVVVPLPASKGGVLRAEFLIYNVWTARDPEGHWTITIQFVEDDGKTGHTVVLPAGVAKVIYGQHDTIIDRSIRAAKVKAHETRAANQSAEPIGEG